MRTAELAPLPHRSTDRLPGFRRRIGRFLASTALVASGTAAVFTGMSVTDAVTHTEPQAEAMPGGNGTERRWCAVPSRIKLCAQANTLADTATKEAVKLHKRTDLQLHNGLADAFRHCYWSGLMTQKFGPKTAQGFTDRHEKVGGQPHAEEVADQYNNAMGRQWAQQPGVDIRARCEQAVNKNELRLVIPYRP